jgi:hypothetical protein
MTHRAGADCRVEFAKVIGMHPGTVVEIPFTGNEERARSDQY